MAIMDHYNCKELIVDAVELFNQELKDQ